MKLRKSQDSITEEENEYFLWIAGRFYKISNHVRKEALNDSRHLMRNGIFDVRAVSKVIQNGRVVEISFDSLTQKLRFMLRGAFDDYIDFCAVFEVGKEQNTVVTVFLNLKTDDHKGKGQGNQEWQGNPIEIAESISKGEKYVAQPKKDRPDIGKPRKKRSTAII